MFSLLVKEWTTALKNKANKFNSCIYLVKVDAGEVTFRRCGASPLTLSDIIRNHKHKSQPALTASTRIRMILQLQFHCSSLNIISYFIFVFWACEFKPTCRPALFVMKPYGATVTSEFWPPEILRRLKQIESWNDPAAVTLSEEGSRSGAAAGSCLSRGEWALDAVRCWSAELRVMAEYLFTPFRAEMSSSSNPPPCRVNLKLSKVWLPRQRWPVPLPEP